MAKLTLLEMTQNILSALDEDEVSNIDDTVSSQQVVEVLKEVYYQIVENNLVPELQQLFRLSAAPGGELALLTIPTNVSRLDSIKYNKIKTGATRPDYRTIKYMSPHEFLLLVDARDSTQSDVVEMTDPTSTNITINILNDQPPTWWTSFDDQYIMFDAYDAVVDASGLDVAKTKCFGQIIPTWTASNSFVPDLDSNQFAYFLTEAKATCFANLKQSENPKTERQARQLKAKQQNDRFRTTRDKFKETQPDFGRR